MSEQPVGLAHLYQLAQTQPTVRAALTLYEGGGVSIEHMLVLLTITLCEQLDRTQAELEQVARRRPPSLRIGPMTAAEQQAFIEAWQQERPITWPNGTKVEWG